MLVGLAIGVLAEAAVGIEAPEAFEDRQCQQEVSQRALVHYRQSGVGVERRYWSSSGRQILETDQLLALVVGFEALP